MEKKYVVSPSKLEMLDKRIQSLQQFVDGILASFPEEDNRTSEQSDFYDALSCVSGAIENVIENYFSVNGCIRSYRDFSVLLQND